MKERDLLISCDDLAAKLELGGVCVVDCRFNLLDPAAGQAEYIDAHIPGAVYANLDTDLAAPVGEGTGRHPLPNPDEFANVLGRLGIDNNTDVVCYDDASGALAARLWWLLRWMGHERAVLLDGGFSRWKSTGRPCESGQVERKKAKFNARPQPNKVLETAEIVSSGANEVLLVDARDATRFAGEAEPIDPVAGHIPGAINVPLGASLNEDGTWKDANELQRLWAAELGDRGGSAWSVMCGSGVTACHLAISGLLAGLPEPRVYVGSWSEWITDPARPVGKGA